MRLGLAAIAALIAFACPAAAQDRAAWFKSLKQPRTGASCCDVSDCMRTEAEWRDGGWRAIVNGKWREIPASRVIEAPHSIDGDPYVCAGPYDFIDDDDGSVTPAPIYCFIPPNMGF